jgi:hypothetical protein
MRWLPERLKARHERARRRWEDNIQIDLKGTEYEDMDYFYGIHPVVFIISQW